MDNIFKSGKPLSESLTRKELGVRRTHIRDALKLLEMENLVKAYPKGELLLPLFRSREFKNFS